MTTFAYVFVQPHHPTFIKSTSDPIAVPGIVFFGITIIAICIVCFLIYKAVINR
jgi:hypothetical protein